MTSSDSSCPAPEHAVASVVIPAHNEERVILRSLLPLAGAASSGLLEVVVVCNGCSDGTAARARTVAGVRVLETATPSKTHALNLGDAAVSAWPRFYLDADVQITEPTIAATVERLGGTTLAGRPVATYDIAGSTRAVAAYYRARGRIQSVHTGLWGAGVYALTEQGRRRFREFPAVSADDLWVDRLFDSHEKAVVNVAEPVVVRVPRTLKALTAITRRNVRGTREPGPESDERPTAGSTARELFASIRGPRTALDAIVYTGVAVWARVGIALSGTTSARWERDDTSRR